MATAAAVTIRRASPEDATSVTEVYLTSRRHAGVLMPRPVHTDDEVRAWFAGTVLVEQDCWVAERDGKVVGLAVLRGTSLDHLYVRPEAQRRGIGSQLVKHVKRQRGRLRLHTFESNHPARAFYEKHGFTVAAFGVSPAPELEPDVEYRWVA